MIPTRRFGAGASAALCVLMLLASAAACAEVFDIVIAHGRVMDPESGLDAVENVGISAGKVRALSSDPLNGRQRIDARGMVVAPGFIDLHEHGQEPRNYEFQARDGVTTSLELELGTADVDKWYAAREGKALVNFGVSAGHIPTRLRVMTGKESSSLSDAVGPAAQAAGHREVTPEELERLRAVVRALRPDELEGLIASAQFLARYERHAAPF